MENPFEVTEDPEILQDYMFGFEEKYEEVEQTLLIWQRTPENHDPLNSLFRLLHSIKGDAKMCHLEPVSELTHSLEEVMSRVRDGVIGYSEQLQECIMLTMDRLQKMSKEAIGRALISTDNLDNIIESLNHLAEAGPEETSKQLRHAISDLSGLPFQDDLPELPPENITPDRDEFSSEREYALTFARTLAERIDNRFPHWENRTAFLLPIAIGMNALNMNSVDFYQLEMAVYLHDFGMLFFRDENIFQKEKFDGAELALLHSHPIAGADLLRNLANWDGAGVMVAQHHERFDGTGYPNNLKGEDICDGARILAICDAFYSMTHNRPDRNTKRSLMRAITEINNCAGEQFCPKWVDKFNSVVKMQYMAGALQERPHK